MFPFCRSTISNLVVSGATGTEKGVCEYKHRWLEGIAKTLSTRARGAEFPFYHFRPFHLCNITGRRKKLFNVIDDGKVSQTTPKHDKNSICCPAAKICQIKNVASTKPNPEHDELKLPPDLIVNKTKQFDYFIKPVLEAAGCSAACRDESCLSH